MSDFDDADWGEPCTFCEGSGWSVCLDPFQCFDPACDGYECHCTACHGRGYDQVVW